MENGNMMNGSGSGHFDLQHSSSSSSATPSPMASPSTDQPVRLILVSGSVMSGIGKGIVASSVAALLKAYGYRVSAIKIDPYLNVDAGTFSPFEHGEVFVLDDGGEVDLDLGNYERFLGVRLSRDNNITSGKIYTHVIERERRGDYLGKTVQVVPHVTDDIVDWVERVSKIPVDESNCTPEVCVIELGGTVGDIETSPYLMAFERAAFNKDPEKYRFMSIHVTKLLDEEMGEIKTKPAQNGLKELSTAGLDLDLLMCRSRHPLDDKTRDKISAFACLIPKKIIDVHNKSSIYEVPLMLEQQNVMGLIRERLRLSPRNKIQTKGSIGDWQKLTDRCKTISSQKEAIKIALIAKYVKRDNSEHVFSDAYASLIKALQHSAIEITQRLEIEFINAEDLEPPMENGSVSEEHRDAFEKLKQCHGILVPGGFGIRGIEGKIEACRYAREQKVPFLGICLGLQCAAIEVARNLCGIKDANSTEFVQEGLTPEQQVVIDMPEHAGGTHGMGATMRLGRRTTVFLTKNSILRNLYGGVSSVDERHRHRYEVNPALVPKLSREGGLLFVGMGVDELIPPNKASVPFSPHNRTESGHELVRMAETKIAETKEELLRNIEELCKEKKNVESEGERKKRYLEKVKILCKGSNLDAEKTFADFQAICREFEEAPKHTSIRMEMAEMDREMHPFFVGVQYHPEYLSRPTQPSPPFLGFVREAHKRAKEEQRQKSQSPEHSPFAQIKAFLEEKLPKKLSEKAKNELMEKWTKELMGKLSENGTFLAEVAQSENDPSHLLNGAVN